MIVELGKDIVAEPEDQGHTDGQDAARIQQPGDNDAEPVGQDEGRRKDQDCPCKGLRHANGQHDNVG
nr:hypothetical protein [Fodinicurvata fenggangensis]